MEDKDDAPEEDDDDSKYPSRLDYAALERLLLRNRTIEVLDFNGGRISNGPRIDQLYLLNDFYSGSKQLVNDSASLRSQLVTTALVESTSTNFPYTALLLSDHMDVLCDLLMNNGVNLDDLDAAAEEIEEEVREETAILPVSDACEGTARIIQNVK